MKRMAVLFAVLALSGLVAAEAQDLSADGDAGYRQVTLEWSMAGGEVEGTVFEVWTNASNAFDLELATLHSTVMVGPTEGLAQPPLGAWYDDCSANGPTGTAEPVHRHPNGTAVVPLGTTDIRCVLTGMPPGEEVAIAVRTVLPDGQASLSEVVLSTSSGEDDLVGALPTSPYLFAIGSIVLSLIALLAGLRWLDARDGRTSSRSAHLFIAPALIALAVLTFYPVLYGMWLALTDADQSRLGEQAFIGFGNFVEVVRTSGFLRVTAFTLVWSVVNVTAHIVVGLMLAMALNSSSLKGRGAYRTVLLLPWAVPSYISVLVWRGMFEPAGIINDLLGTELNLLADPAGARLAVILVNIWLGIPFMMMSISGALQALPQDMYEAAEMDGAGPWTQFTNLTLPNLRSALVPLSLLGFIWTFNMFNVIYLMTDGGPNLDFDGPGSTDILITYVYDVAFRDGAYGVAAAWSVVIFLMLVAFSWTYMQRTNATEAVA